MKKVVALVLLLANIGFSQNSETFTKKLETAKTENKNVLLYFSGSDWFALCV